MTGRIYFALLAGFILGSIYGVTSYLVRHPELRECASGAVPAKEPAQ